MESREDQEIMTVDIFLESTLESADWAEKLVLEAAEKLGFEEDELHRIGMAVRETVVNAVVHGNRYSAHKRVRFRIFKAPDHLAVTVQDEGNGFDLSALPDPLAQENLLQQSGRGLLLVRAFVDKLEICRTAAGGTQVRLIKYLPHRPPEKASNSV
jgi:serine/threonine-protein kinase RsbW